LTLILIQDFILILIDLILIDFFNDDINIALSSLKYVFICNLVSRKIFVHCIYVVPLMIVLNYQLAVLFFYV